MKRKSPLETIICAWLALALTIGCVDSANALEQPGAIRIDEAILTLPQNTRTVELTLHNLDRELNLNEYLCRWVLIQDGVEIDAGEMRIDLEPGETMPLGIRIQPPDNHPDHEYHLRILFLDRIGNPILDRFIRLESERWRENLLMRMRNLRYDDDWRVFADAEIVRADHESFSFHWKAVDNFWFMLIRDRNVRLVIDGPYLYWGEGADIGESLGRLEPLSRQLTKIDANMELRTVQTAHPREHEENELRMKVDLLFSPYGYCDARFSIPANEAMRGTGLAFVVPDTLTHAALLGDGELLEGDPNSAVAGVYHPLAPIETWWDEPPPKHQALAIVNERGYGLGLVTLNAQIELKPHPAGTLVIAREREDNTSNSAPQHPAAYLFEQVRGATFRLLPLVPGRYPILFQWISD